MVQNISNIRTSNYVYMWLVPEKALITVRIEQNMKTYSKQIRTIPCDDDLLSLPGAVPPAGRGGRGQAVQLGGGGGGLAGPPAAAG